MATESDFYSLQMLPLPRFDDPTLSVWAVRDKWHETHRILLSVQRSQVTLGAEVQQTLDNLRYYCQLALGAIDHFQMLGGNGLEPTIMVEGLPEITKAFLGELPNTQAVTQAVTAVAQPTTTAVAAASTGVAPSGDEVSGFGAFGDVFCDATEANQYLALVQTSYVNLATGLNAAKTSGALDPAHTISSQIVSMGTLVGTYLGTYGNAEVVSRLSCDVIAEGKNLHTQIKQLAANLQAVSGVDSGIPSAPSTVGIIDSLMSSFTTLAIYGGLGYMAYRYFMAPSSTPAYAKPTRKRTSRRRRR